MYMYATLRWLVVAVAVMIGDGVALIVENAIQFYLSSLVTVHRES